jgi:solute carrier family 25 2-oxodicarboxylate transporter 21
MSGSFETIPPIAAACAVTAAAMYPVDVARALKMASATGTSYTLKTFIQDHGVSGLLKQGVAPEVARATWMRILKFYFFPITYKKLWKKPPSQGTWYEKAIAGAIAVTPEVATITTLELAKIGLQLDKEKKYHNSGLAVAREAYQRYGWRGAMVGWQGVQARQMLWTSTYMASLGFFKDTTSKVLGKSNPSINNFVAGFVAGVAGAVANTPADIIRTNIQKEALQVGTKNTSLNALCFSFGKMGSVGREIYNQKGFRGLYYGFGFKSMHMGGSGAFVAMLIPVFAKLFGVQQEILG